MNKSAGEISVRDFRKSDLEDVSELGRLCFAREFELKGLDVEHLTEKVEQLFGFTGRFLLFLLQVFGRRPFRFFVAEAYGKVVGTTMVSRQVNVGYISWVMVHQDYRGRGIAKRLLEKTVEYARKSGMEKVALHVDSTNDQAKNLYIKMGFKKFEKLAHLVGDVTTISFTPELVGEICIRNFQEKDIDSVYELVKLSEDSEHLRVFSLRKESLKGSLLARFFKLFNESKIVATHKDSVVGYVAVVYTTAKEAGRISNIYVHPKMRSMGIEELLIFSALNEAKRVGLKNVLTTVSLRRPELISVIKHCGFEEKFEVSGMVLDLA